jgi:acetaldehyde dehydrogenase/alcohol dehydrogenase
LGIQDSFQEVGINPKDFEAKVDWLADRAFEDQCTTANPRMPLVTELAEIYRKAFYGKFEV